MKYYKYDEFGFLSGSREAQANPEKKGKFLGCGKDETDKKPLSPKADKVNHWSGSEWELVEDNRNKQIWNNDGVTKLVAVDNIIPVGWTLRKYKPFHKWNGSAWVADAGKKQELIAALTARIETETANKILNDFNFAGKKFSLSDKNQFAYKAEYDICANLTYPHKIKCVDGYYEIPSLIEHQNWYLAGLQFIRACTVSAWEQIDDLQNKTTKQLMKALTPST